MLTLKGVTIAVALMQSGTPIPLHKRSTDSMPPAIPQEQVRRIPEYKKKVKKKKPLYHMA